MAGLLKYSQWRAARNARSLERLRKALPEIFPAIVLTRALSRPFIPPTPRLAVDGYWRAHPLRADRLARALARKSGAPAGWTWRLHPRGAGGLSASLRTPPAPYREKAFSLGPGHCCVCGQPVYRLGWHADLWHAVPNKNANWHSACVIAWQLWNAPSDYAKLLRKIQRRRCAASAGRLWKNAEVDHRIPLFQVWREHRDMPWPALLAFWGAPNLQVINREAHVDKCADEAGDRARVRRAIELARSARNPAQ
jgi:hypothetical protein